jgi:hypothetical protein
MTYSPITPQSQPSPAATQAQIQTNFAQFASIFAKNHSALNTKNQGDHEAVILEKLASDPGVINDLVSLYSKDATAKSGIQPQLFAEILKFLPTPNDPTDADNIGMQLTQSTVNLVGPNQFQSFLPGNFMLYFGTVTANGTVILSPAPTTIHSVLAIPNNITTNIPSLVSVVVNQTTNDRFDIFSNAIGAFSFTWIAIATA